MNPELGADADDLDWQSYEALVADIHGVLGAYSGTEILCSGRTCIVEGPPGIPNQIDVLTSHSDGVHVYRTGISCKWQTRKVGIAHVREFAFIVQESNLSKGVIVSRSGFTKYARKLAEAKNIGLLELRKPIEEDWGDSITDIRGEVIFSIGHLVREVRFQRAEPIPADGDGRSETRMPMPHQLVIVKPGETPQTLIEIAEGARSANPGQERLKISFPAGTTLSAPSDPGCYADGLAVRGVSFGLQPVPRLRTEIGVRAAEAIYMRMRDVFTDRLHNVTSDGYLVEAR